MHFKLFLLSSGNKMNKHVNVHKDIDELKYITSGKKTRGLVVFFSILLMMTFKALCFS